MKMIKTEKQTPEITWVKKEREYGVDLLRIVSMFMVVVLHMLGNGGILDTAEPLSVNYSVSCIISILLLFVRWETLKQVCFS